MQYLLLSISIFCSCLVIKKTKTRNPCCDRNLKKKNLKFGTLYGFSALCYQSELIEENDIDLYKSIETNKLKSKHFSYSMGHATCICIKYHSLTS